MPIQLLPRRSRLPAIQEIKFGGKLKELEEVASSGGDLSVHTIQEMRHAVEAMLHDTQGEQLSSGVQNVLQWK